MVTAKGARKIRRTVAHDYEIRGAAQGACGLKRFSWNANTREVSQKNTNTAASDAGCVEVQENLHQRSMPYVWKCKRI